MHSFKNVSDIARALSRVQRWNGDTLLPWSVLQHTLAGLALIPGEREVHQVNWLLHDAEESLTGDIPKPFKVGEQVAFGETIRRQIFTALGLLYPAEGEWAKLDALDQRVACAEAAVLCPPDVAAMFSFTADPEATTVVTGLVDITPREAVDAYLTAIDQLLALPRIKAMAGRV
jgi:5'-deoxynucleotidase YfbR-like HD superfamily hydrolase